MIINISLFLNKSLQILKSRSSFLESWISQWTRKIEIWLKADKNFRWCGRFYNRDRQEEILMNREKYQESKISESRSYFTDENRYYYFLKIKIKKISRVFNVYSFFGFQSVCLKTVVCLFNWRLSFLFVFSFLLVKEYFPENNNEISLFACMFFS